MARYIRMGLSFFTVAKQLCVHNCTHAHIILFNQFQRSSLARQIALPYVAKSSHNLKTLRSWDIFTTLLIFFGVVEDLEKMDPVILNIKRGILAMQRKQHHKAELILHTALKMAQDVGNTDAETYIFDVMADNYLEKGDFPKAKDLYLNVITRISTKANFSHENEEMVEISTKLAYCLGRIGEPEQSEKGFQFSIDTQLGRTDKFWDNKLCKQIDDTVPLSDEQQNSLALLGLCYDYYSKHLCARSSQLLKYALGYRLKALAISRAVNGVGHDQTLVLENDVADLYLKMEQYPEAKGHLTTAITGAKVSGSTDLPLYYLNMASLHAHQDRLDLAKPFCQKSLDLLGKFKEEMMSARDRKLLQDKSEHCLNGHKFY